MKQKFSLRWLCATILLLCSTYASAYDFVTDGICYNVVSSTDLTCEVTYRTSSYNTYSGSVAIPETVTRSSNGYTYTVVGIGSSAFRNSSTSSANLTEVIIPTTVTYIKGYAFYRSAKLTSLTIPNSVTSIGDDAFYYCTALSEITIPISVTSIGNRAFYNCTSLEDVTLEDGEETLVMTTNSSYTPFTDCSALKTLYFGRNLSYTDTYAPFRGNTSLTSIVIGNKVTSIGQYEFYGCTSLEDVTLEDGEETLTMTTSSSYRPFTNCPIKTLYLGRNLSYTDTYAPFRGNTSLSSLVIGDKVTSIGQYEFYGCTNLTDVTLEDGEETLTMTTSSSYTPFTNCSAIKTLYLGRNLSYTDTYSPFRGKTKLSTLTIGDKVTSIGQYAFYGCTGLTGELIIPSNVTSISNYAFYNCSSVQNLTIADGEKTLKMTTSSSATPFTNCSAIKTLYLGRNISYNSEYSPFRGKTKLSTLTIGDKVTSIGQYAFYGCTGLTGELIIQSVVTSIGDRAFYNCSTLEDVTLEDGEEILTMTTSSSATPFTGCSALKTLYFGRNLSYTDTYAPFRGNTSLTSIVIGNKVTSIGQYEFYGCTSLEDVTLEDGEETLTMTTNSSYRPFTNCPIKTLYLGRNINYDSSYSPFRENTYLTSLTIGDKVTSIDEYEFYGCTNLTGELVIPSSITEIGDRAFYNCSSIETLILEDGKEILTMATSSSYKPFTNCCFSTLHVGRDVTYSSSYSPFRDNTSLTTLTLGNTVTTICEYEFYYCTNMTGEVVIPNSVTEINQYAFYNCTHLTALTFEDGEKTLTIANNSYSTVFYSCPIVALHLGRTVSYYSSYSPFRGNTSLTSLTIGDKVTSIGQYAFYGCSNIVGELAIPNEVSEIGNYAFYDCSGLNAVTIGDGATSIGSSAFRGCSSLEQINIPDNVVTIGSDAFRSCSAMKEATIGRGVNVLGGGAFESCTALERVNYNATDCSSSNSYVFYLCDNLSVFNIGDNVITIPTYLCRDCSAIKEIVIPNSVISIGDYSFENCSGITALTLGDNLSTTGMYSFYGCSAIKEVTIPKNITKLDIYTFGNCTSLQEITFNATSCSSANTVFSSCPNLQKATIGDEVLLVPAFLFSSTSLTELYIGKSVVDIGNFAFSQCLDLIQVDYCPTDCSSESSSPFMSCDNLSNVNIGDNVRTIPEYLFSNCPAIKEIIIPNSVTTIGQSAFSSCSALESVVIGNRVTEIGNYAFYDCLSLTSLTLGSRVEDIGRFAFAYCENLEEIYSYNSEPPVCKSSVFDDVNKKTCILYVPIGSKGDYSTADTWKDFYNIVEVELPDGIESVSTSSYNAEVIGYYTIDGKAVETPQRGINIVKYSDGSTKKVIMK